MLPFCVLLGLNWILQSKRSCGSRFLCSSNVCTRIFFTPTIQFSQNSSEFPHSWIIDDSRKDGEGDGGSGSEAESDDESQNAVKTSTSSSSPQKPASQTYLEFLQFLQLGCSGSPLQGYPAVVIIVSTIPSSVRRLFVKESLLAHIIAYRLWLPALSTTQNLLHSQNSSPLSGQLSTVGH